MKRLLFLLFLIPFIAGAQKYQDPLIYGKSENRLQVLTNLGLPNDTIPPDLQHQNLPQVAFKSGSMWVWDPVLHKYVIVIGGGSTYSNGYAINILSNAINVDSNLLITRANFYRLRDSSDGTYVHNQISSIQSSAAYWVSKGRIDNYLGVNTNQLGTELFGVNGTSRLGGDVNMPGGWLYLSNNPARGSRITLDDQAGRSGIIQVQSQGMMMGTETQHDFAFLAGNIAKIIIKAGDPSPFFPGISAGFAQVIMGNNVKPLGIDEFGKVAHHNFGYLTSDSLSSGKFGFVLDPMMYAAFDAANPSNPDTLGVYHVDSIHVHSLGIIDSVDYANLYRAYDNYVVSGSYSSGTITMNKRNGGSFTITGLASLYTDEMVDDRVAALVLNGTGISWSYNDGSNTLTPTVTLSPFTTTNLTEGSNLYYTTARVDTRLNAYTGDVTFASGVSTIGATKVTEAMLNTSDVTTANVSTTKHGYAPKLPNDATKFLNGVGGYTVPPVGLTDNGFTADVTKTKVIVKDTATGLFYHQSFAFVDMSSFVNNSFVKYDSVNNKFIAGTPAAGVGEANTASSLGGGLAIYSTKVGVDFRFNTLDAADFDLNTNTINIDATLKATWNGKQNALSGTGFVKISGTTISYDATTYVPTTRTYTINGVTQDASADRTWTITAASLLPSFTGNDGKVLGLVSGSLAWITNGSGGGYSLPSLTQGSVIFKGATDLSQDNSNFFYDATNHFLGLGTAVPTHTLTLGSTSTGTVIYNTVDQTTNYERIHSYWSGNVYNINTEAGGTGIQRNINIGGNFLLSQSPVIAGFYQFNKGTSAINTSTLGVIPNGQTASSGMQNAILIGGTINQTGTAGYRSLWISPFEQGNGSGSHLLIDAGTNTAAAGGGTHTSKFSVDNAGAGIFVSSVTASSFVKPGGTSSQFLKADGSVDNNTYAMATGTAAQYIKGNGTLGTLPSTLSSFTNDANYAQTTVANTWLGKQSFNTTSGAAAIGIGAFATEPTGLSDGDIWYNSSVARFYVRENGVSKIMLRNEDMTFTAAGDISGGSTCNTGCAPVLTVEGIRGNTVPVPSVGYLFFNGTNFVWSTPGASIATGTTNNIPKYTSSSTIGGSSIWEVGSNVGIGQGTPLAASKLTLKGLGTTAATYSLYATNGSDVSTAFVNDAGDLFYSGKLLSRIYGVQDNVTNTYTIPQGNWFVTLGDLTGAGGNRGVVIPTANNFVGQVIKILITNNNPSFNWIPSNGVLISKTSTTITVLANQTSYEFVSVGGYWRQTN
jgi:hypothetical protein